MLFTVDNVQNELTITITETAATSYTFSYNTTDGAFRNGRITSGNNNQSITPGRNDHLLELSQQRAAC